MDLGIKGKTALVVAASKGMGRASALGLAAEAARVVMWARGEAALKDAAAEVRGQSGADVVGLGGDASRAADISGVVAEANRAFGGVDILVANVGGPPPGPFEQMTDEHWKTAFEQVHLSTVRFIREVLPHMKQARWGRILAIQSSSVKQPVDRLVLSNGIRPGCAVRSDGGRLGSVVEGARSLPDRAGELARPARDVPRLWSRVQLRRLPHPAALLRGVGGRLRAEPAGGDGGGAQPALRDRPGLQGRAAPEPGRHHPAPSPLRPARHRGPAALREQAGEAT